MEYIYNNIYSEPNLTSYNSNYVLISSIHYDILNSDMVDKSLEFCRWDEDSEILKVKFTNTLSSDDKDKLDIIVSDNS